ncbi:MAG: hypothetical protein NC390_01480 [Fusobacterium sp.]|nr:hypothetical protein [Fusobacterium sp.]
MDSSGTDFQIKGLAVEKNGKKFVYPQNKSEWKLTGLDMMTSRSYIQHYEDANGNTITKTVDKKDGFGKVEITSPDGKVLSNYDVEYAEDGSEFWTDVIVDEKATDNSRDKVIELRYDKDGNLIEKRECLRKEARDPWISGNMQLQVLPGTIIDE